MFKICLNLARFNLTKIEGSLKVLKLDPPTTKKQIKQKYLQLAKQLHPDIKNENGPTPTPQKMQQRSQAFIEITKAYKFLNQLTQSQINNPNTETHNEYFGSNTDQNASDNKRQYQKPLSPEQRTRRATYAYFNKKYRKQNSQYEQKKKEPLYKQIPQFFLGCLFVAIFFIEWGYTAIKRSAANIQKEKKDDLSQVIEGFSFKKKFQKNIE